VEVVIEDTTMDLSTPISAAIGATNCPGA